jgi:hypothetical protein
MVHPSTTALLRWFEFEHIRSEELRSVSKVFHDVAHGLAETLPEDPETTVALRHLLEAKDSAVRAALSGLDSQEQKRLAGHPKE